MNIDLWPKSHYITLGQSISFSINSTLSIGYLLEKSQPNSLYFILSHFKIVYRCENQNNKILRKMSFRFCSQECFKQDRKWNKQKINFNKLNCIEIKNIGL